MVVDESCRPKVAQWLGRCGRSLRGQARKAFHCGCDEIAITSQLPNEGIPKPARSWNPKRGSSLKVSHKSGVQERSPSKVASVAVLYQPSTDAALQDLTSVIGREPVFFSKKAGNELFY